MPVPAKKSCDHQPYITHACFGRYLEHGQSWSEKLSTCAEKCDLRFKCFKHTQDVKGEDNAQKVGHA